MFAEIGHSVVVAQQTVLVLEGDGPSAHGTDGRGPVGGQMHMFCDTPSTKSVVTFQVVVCKCILKTNITCDFIFRIL